jgi:phosphatidylserine/phosphatidylglycerophosphate/cardiolipin synthase-like enzyme
MLSDGFHARVRLVASPRALLADQESWDLPLLLETIEETQHTLWVQLLSLDVTGRDGEPFPALADALHRAAARGVDVRLLLADWCKREGTIEGLQALERVPGIEVRLVSLPESREGPIPYARVVHAKYLVADGQRAWLGSGNWGRDYFYASRNVGIVAEGAGFAARLADFFLDGWRSAYAETVDPSAHYEPPRIGD